MAKDFSVDNVEKRIELDERGEMRTVYIVSFTTATGILSDVSIPVNLFSKEKVQEMLEFETKRLDEIMGL